MLSLFYQMKVKKNKTEIFEEYYRSVLEKETMDFFCKEDSCTKCRICLREGITPIYGNDRTEEIIEIIENLSNNTVNESDGYPKLLCTLCYNFIKAAVMFRKTAKHAEKIMARSIKPEVNMYEPLDDHHEYSDSSINEKNSDQQWAKDQPIKKERKEQMPYNAKVTCKVCNKVINRSYYKEHVTMHEPDHKKFVCDVCGKSFRLRCAFYNHSLRHGTDFPYKCQFCPYQGQYKELLKTHMRTHTGDYRYMCTECPARFLVKSNLNSHMLKHKEPKFKCDACKRAFHTKLRVQRHFEADHLGIKNHVCSICGKAFGYRHAMTKHQRHVHKREKLLHGRMPTYLQAGCDNQG